MRLPHSSRNRPKKCHCDPTCGKVLSLRQRIRHYQNAANKGLADQICASEGISSDADTETHANLPEMSDIPESPGPHLDSSEDDESSSTSSSPQDDDFGHWDWVDVSDSDGDLCSTKMIMDAVGEAENEKTEDALYDMRNYILSENDRDNIRAFNLLLRGKIGQTGFKQMRLAFRHKMNLDSEFIIFNRVIHLAAIKMVKYDCCPQSCILYAGRYRQLIVCPHCNQPRFKANRRPRRQFTYFPLIPRLQGFFQSPQMIRMMDYRASYVPTPGCISDMFDGIHYQKLKAEYVEVDGERLAHRYFCNDRDIALALCTDSYSLYKGKRGGPAATPIVLQNYNIPPNQRTHHRHLLCVGIIPGPKQPKELNSFLSPLDDELAELAYGVRTFDAINKVTFNLHAYIIFSLGDILAIEKFLEIKGHNAIFPCRSCKIRAVRGLGKTHYAALQPPKGGRKSMVWDPTNLPMRSHEEFITTSERISDAPSKAAKQRIAKETGIRGLPGLRRVGSLDYARSIPWEWFHLFLENIIPNLVNLWTGQFKGFEPATDEFTIATKVWEDIAQETMAAVEHIPATFIRALGSLSTNRSQFTAEAWGFWFVYLMPILLENRFPKQKYYIHACELGALMKVMLQFCMTEEELDDIEVRLRKWVQKYEKYYYQRRIEHLPACTLTAHGMLHITEGIRYCGPVWTTWSFFMERYCGALQRSTRSRSQPWSNLDNTLLRSIALEQLSVRYDLSAELTLWDDREGDEPVGFERVLEDYPDHVIRPPFKRIIRQDQVLQQKIAQYMAQVLAKRESEVRKRLPPPVFSAGKVRIRGGGDSFRTTAMMHKRATLQRRNCYMKYEVVLETRDHRSIHVVGYGDLNNILILTLPTDTFFSSLSGKTLILALITPWKTEGRDATMENTYLSSRRAPIITDVRNLKAVVGLVPVGKRWGIIDRMPATCTQNFADKERWEDTSESESDVEEIDELFYN